MLAITKTDHYTINYPLGQEAEVLAFYGEKLQLPQITNLVENTFWFKMGDIELHLSPGETNLKESRHAAFIVDDLEKSKLFLNGKDILIENSTRTTKIEGRERLFFRDPFGNRFELIEFTK